MSPHDRLINGYALLPENDVSIFVCFNAQNFELLTGKTSFFVIGPFCTHRCICLTLASNMAVLYGKDGFSLLALSDKKQYSSF